MQAVVSAQARRAAAVAAAAAAAGTAASEMRTAPPATELVQVPTPAEISSDRHASAYTRADSTIETVGPEIAVPPAKAAQPKLELVQVPTPAEVSLADSQALADTSACMEASQMLQGELRGLGNDWVDVGHPIDVTQLLQIATEMASDERVQQVALTAARRNNAEMTLRLMHEQTSMRAGAFGPVTTHGPQSEPSLGHSFLEVPSSDDVQSLASSGSLTPSAIEQAEAEMNRSFLDPHATMLQAAARGHLARRAVAAARLRTPRAGVLLDHLPCVPRAKISLVPTQSHDGTVSIALRLDIISIKHVPSTPKDDAASDEPDAEPARQRPALPVEVASAVAVVVGLLAVVISRNPVAARATAPIAAAVIAALCARAVHSHHFRE